MQESTAFWRVVFAVSAIKLLLIPSYRSTDFEVHRNWLAITHALPLRQWYEEETSPWTLDYPPLFAWFEYLLAKIAVFFDPAMLIVQNLNYASFPTILFQVVLHDIHASWKSVATRSPLSTNSRISFFGLVVGNVGLLMADHVHFQYNGMLIGLLIWSVLAVEHDRGMLAALLFAVLLNLKHLFMYSAPVFFAFLFRRSCLDNGSFQMIPFCKLGLTVLSVCAASFGPFAIQGQIPKILSRLFPFGRGLCHAYWAPNAWALYSFTDKLISFALRLYKPTTEISSANMTGHSIANLEFVGTIVSLSLVMMFASLPAFYFFRRPRKEHFMECVAYANLCGFVWGYHVHEKAILTVLIPLAFVAFRKGQSLFPFHRRHFLFLSTVAHYSLTPLLHEPQEYPIKLLLILSYAFYLASVLREDTPSKDETPSFAEALAKGCKAAVLVALLMLELSQLTVSIFGMKTSLEFLPLMMTSVLCSCAICGYWLIWTSYIMSAVFGGKKKKL